MPLRFSARLFFAVSLLFSVGCVTAPPKVAPPSVPVCAPAPVPITAGRPPALVRLEAPNLPAFTDDEDTGSLRTAALQSMAYYRTLPEGQLFVLAHDTYTAHEMADSMAYLSASLECAIGRKEWLQVLASSFTVYESLGADPERTVVFSSYYEPLIVVRAARTDAYRFPLYARPHDLIDVDLSRFDDLYQGAHVSGRREGRTLLPYPTRADIDGKKILQGGGLELAWAKDPLDVLDLQIEGSGWLDFGGGDVRRIRYDGDNGHRYRSVGQYLISTGRIPARKFSRQVFWRYMKHHPKERQKLLNINERYVFFRIDTSTTAPYAYGDIDVPLTPGRSMATDPKIFPKGALAWIDTERSIVGHRDKVKGKRPLKRFMLNQDEGGAIQGPGRVDIFAGYGEDAKRLATHLWYKGKLYFLVKKKNEPRPF